MNYLTDTFYWISTGLLVPVMVLLLVNFVYSLVLLGAFYAHFTERRKFLKELGKLLSNVESSTVRDLPFKEHLSSHFGFSTALEWIQKHGWKDVYQAKAMSDFEMVGEKQLEKAKTLMRIGPMLGLMGTLIPMGPALVGLGNGDIASMAMNMQVAFSTTVIGVFLGGVGFVIHTVRKRWLTEDFYQLQFIIQLAENE